LQLLDQMSSAAPQDWRALFGSPSRSRDLPPAAWIFSALASATDTTLITEQRPRGRRERESFMWKRDDTREAFCPWKNEEESSEAVAQTSLP
jgi:hypothetical protein